MMEIQAELWSISDQGSKLSLISDLHPGNNGSSPEDLTIVGNTLYFSADEGMDENSITTNAP